MLTLSVNQNNTAPLNQKMTNTLNVDKRDKYLRLSSARLFTSPPTLPDSTWSAPTTLEFWNSQSGGGSSRARKTVPRHGTPHLRAPPFLALGLDDFLPHTMGALKRWMRSARMLVKTRSRMNIPAAVYGAWLVGREVWAESHGGEGVYSVKAAHFRIEENIPAPRVR
jgi:hypothetical protein